MIANGFTTPPADDPQRVNYERANAPQNLKLRGESATKPPVGIVPMHPLLGVSRVYEDSAIKYAPFNYMVQAVEEAIASYDSAELRHRISSTNIGGEVTAASYATPDPDSGIPHIYHRIAGLLIIASLMIRDGVIPADPGMGKRKRNAVEAERARQTSYHMATAPGDAPPLAQQLAAREVQRVQRTDGVPCYGNGCPGDRTCAACKDAARRAAADANVEQIKRDALKLAESKREWDQRCLECAPWRGLAKIGYTVEDAEGAAVHVLCKSCKGTGQRTGAEGVRL